MKWTNNFPSILQMLIERLCDADSFSRKEVGQTIGLACMLATCFVALGGTIPAAVPPLRACKTPV